MELRTIFKLSPAKLKALPKDFYGGLVFKRAREFINVFSSLHLKWIS
jgi:hypothetical protein